MSAPTISLQANVKPFRLVHEGGSVPVLYEPQDANVVRIAAEALAGDIELISGVQPTLSARMETDARSAVIIGSLGGSPLIDELANQGRISKKALAGKWETFLLQTVKNPLPGMDEVLVIAGSDPRGTAFGVFEVSKRLGVSPWVYWADVTPAKCPELSVEIDSVIVGPPSVKYRGIFLNDEDWGLHPWAAKNMDTDIKDIGPKTYARIFELLLRLKANFIWPAMHPCTKAFYYYPENGKVADQYGIVVGTSHCEPMLRNNVDEWAINFEEEYGKKPGAWCYDTNRNEVLRYWEDRVSATKHYECMYTIGMRGIHDGEMPGGKTFEDKMDLMTQVIADQRKLIEIHSGSDPALIPQTFCPYKEVLKLYQAGIEVPEDVTIIWPDDNHGYVRNLSTPEEQKRSGGTGIYYHLSYWGVPADYLWLSSMSPALISYELSKSYAYGADRLWVINVGDIKPTELEMEFALELGWDVERYRPEKAMTFVLEWAAREFGERLANAIVDIKKTYYQLGHACKPEHLLSGVYGVKTTVPFTSVETQRRLSEYSRITAAAEVLYADLPEDRKDAFYQLVLYPVKAAALMNQKHLCARMAQETAGKESAELAEKSRRAFEEIKQITDYYNREMAGGKWDGMMSWHPRDLDVFDMPSTTPATPALQGGPDAAQHKADGGSKTATAGSPGKEVAASIVTMSATDYIDSHDGMFAEWRRIEGLGLGGAGLTTMPFTSPPLTEKELDRAPCCKFSFEAEGSTCELEVRCLPTHRIHEGRALRYAVSIDDGPVQVADVDSPAKSRDWFPNVMRGYSVGKTVHKLKPGATHDIKLHLLDAGMVLNRLELSIEK